MRHLELLAPARTTEIGIAAIDCGADAVYIAGPSFGARQAAGNSVEDIAGLCAYAHRFGCRIYVTLNTILFDNELEEAGNLLHAVTEAGADAVIVQDPALLRMGSENVIFHASTQCAIRTPEKAAYLESLGFGRLILERQLSLQEIRAIREATSAELEFFVHGALCVSYSGQCYLSESITGRSANRGACIQACRSLYDLTDASGRVLGRNKAYLSLKDLMLLDRLEDLAAAGICSFKIEGRLKNSSYVRSVVKSYSAALDALVNKHPEKYCRSSFGHSNATAPASLDKTFNRGYTQLYLDGKKGRWASLDTPKSMGEAIGSVQDVRRSAAVTKIRVIPASPGLVLCNGDGFAFVRKDGGIGGFRGFRCNGTEIECRGADGLEAGMPLYRNLSMEFERSVAAEKVAREIPVELDFSESKSIMTIKARSEDGRCVVLNRSIGNAEAAKDRVRMEETVKAQLGKRSSVYNFSVNSISCEGPMPFLTISFLNQARRDIADKLDAMPVRPMPLDKGATGSASSPSSLDYRANSANRLSRELYASTGTTSLEPAYELSHRPGAELMRSRYCLRHELGLCPKQAQKGKMEDTGGGQIFFAPPCGEEKVLVPDGKWNREESPKDLTLYLHNNGRTLTLEFHCRECEMVVK